MAETIEGGAALRNGQWVNANGEPLTKEQIAAAEKLVAENQAARDQAEDERLLLEARNNPTARGIAQALDASRQAAKPAAPSKA